MAVPTHAYAINPGPLGWFVRQLRTQRGRICILGNSNEFFNTGSAGGRLRGLYIEAAAAGIPIYSTPAMTLAGANGTTGAAERSSGFIAQDYPDFNRYSTGNTNGNYFEAAYLIDPLDGANTNWLPLGLVHKWGRTETAGTVYSTLLALHCMTGTDASHPLAFANNGIYSVNISPTDPNVMQWTEKFRGEFWYSNVTPAGGTLRPAISVNNVLTAQTAALTAAAGTPTWRNLVRAVTSDVAAGSRAGTVKLGFTTINGTAMSGDVALSYLFAVHPDRTTGLGIDCPWAAGGASMLDVAYSHYNSTRSTTDEAIYHYLQAVCQMQADKDHDPIFCLVLADTLNGRNETATTAWQTAADADSPEAMAMHSAYVIERWRRIWGTLELVGSDGTTIIRTKDERFKCAYALDHAIGVPDDAEQVAYREQAGAILAAKFPDTVTALRMDNIVNATDLYAVNSNQGYYSSTTKTANAITAATYPEITTTATHGLVAGQYVTISGSNSTPVIDGARRVRSIVSTTKFTIDDPVVTVAGTTGTVTIRDTNHLTKEGYAFYGEKFWAAALSLPSITTGTARLRGR